MRAEQFTITISQPYLTLLKLEAANSQRTVEAHVSHVLGRRYDNLIRVCIGCGYFLYAASDDLRCAECQRSCCPYCSIPQDDRDICFKCCARLKINVEGKGGFRAADEGKV